MTRITLSSFFLGLFCLSMLQTEAKSSIDFQQFTFSEVKTKAAQEQKHFFAYVYGNWCLGCQIMEETTFTDQKLGQYVNNEFVAVKVDIHSALGKDWDEEFQITCLPTFLIFDEYGQLLDRLESTITGSALYQVLQESTEPGFIASTQSENLFTVKGVNATVNSIAPTSGASFPSNTNGEYVNNTSIPSIPNSFTQSKESISSSKKKGNSSNRISTANEEKIINEYIAQLEFLLQMKGTESSTNSEPILPGISCKELFSSPEEVQVIINALRAKKDANVDKEKKPVIKEAVVTAMVPYERHTVTNASANEAINNNSTIKKLYTKGSHKIQLGEYTDYKKASAVVKKIEAKFESKKVFLLIDKKGNYSKYKVLVKGFDNQHEASNFILALKEMGFKL